MSRSRRARRARIFASISLISISIIALAGAPSTAYADAADEQRAVVLFDKGRKLAREGKCAEAISPLLESIRYAEGVGPLLNLGNCYETLGKTASAHKYFLRAQEVAATRDDNKRRDEAAQRAKSIEKDLSTIIVHIPAAIRNVAEVRIDGESLPKDHWDSPTPVDPGPHEIEVVAPPNPKQTETVNVRGKGDRVEWTAPVAQAASNSGSSSKPIKGSPAAVSPVPKKPEDTRRESPDEPSPGSTQRTLGLVTGGAGLVGLTIGGIFGVMSLSAHASVTGRCPTYPRCPISQKSSLDEMNSDASSAGTISTISVVAGALLLIGGVALYFTAPQSRTLSGAN